MLFVCVAGSTSDALNNFYLLTENYEYGFPLPIHPDDGDLLYLLSEVIVDFFLIKSQSLTTVKWQH